MTNRCQNRRTFLRRTAGIVGAAAISPALLADDLPPIVNPRSTSSDTTAEPNWRERLTVTVGREKADMVGTGDKVIQAAMDYVARLGGGTVHVLPGEYVLRSPIHLRRGVRLLGSGPDSVLVKCPMIETALAADSDWYDREITLADDSGFEIGDTIMLLAKNAHYDKSEYLMRRLIARDGNRFKLDRALKENFWLSGGAKATNLFPLLYAEETSDVAAENLRLDGNRKENAHINGNYCGCIFAQDVIRMNFRGLDVGHFNGDGISHQICHDVHIEDCSVHDNADLGIHSGSGSQRAIARRNTITGNQYGYFFCWGVKFSLVEDNTIDKNEQGISIGHRDTDNWIRNNRVTSSGKVGIIFRPERGQGYSADRNRVEGNEITNSGGEDGIAVDVQGYTADCRICKNTLQETRGPAKRIGIRLGEHTRNIDTSGNRIEGFAVEIEDKSAT